MKVLLSTQSAATRGSYATVCREIWTRICQADPSIEVVQHGWNHRNPTETVPWDIIPTATPEEDPDKAMRDLHGDETFGEVVRRTQPDIVWHLGSPFNGQAVAEMKPELGYKLINYFPVPAEPLNHFNDDWMRKLGAADCLVSATDFGTAALEALPLPESVSIMSCIPHGVNREIFFPLPDTHRAQVRAQIGGEAADEKSFVLGWVGHDQFRKQVWVLYEMMYYLRSGDWLRCNTCNRLTVNEFDHLQRGPRAVGRLRRYAPDYDYQTCWHCGSGDIVAGQPRENVALWTVMDNNLAIGYDLRMLAHTYRVEEAIFNTSATRGGQGHTFEQMNLLYNCFDALVFPSGGEGFGMPVLEAMACGKPAIYSNYSGHADFAVGLPTAVQLMPHFPDPFFFAVADMGELVGNVIRMMDDHAERESLSRQSLETARAMDWDRYTDRWLDCLYTVHAAN